MISHERLLIENTIVRVRYYCNKCGQTLDFDQQDMHNETLSCGCPAHELKQEDVPTDE